MITTSQGSQIKIYSNLLNPQIHLHSWNSNESFDIEKLNAEERESIQKLEAIEVSFLGVGKNRYLFDALFKKFDAFVKQFVLYPEIPSYIFKSEFKKQVKNRVRTYKGIVSREIEKQDYIQVEIPIINDYTIIAALIKLNKNNIDKLLESFTDNSLSCIIASDNNSFFSEESIYYVVNNAMQHKGTSNINYAKLITKYCPNGNIISRIGGDGGDHEVCFQTFCEVNKRDLIILQNEKALESII